LVHTKWRWQSDGKITCDDKGHSLGELEDQVEKTKVKAKVYDRTFGFGTKDTIESVCAFRIDSRTIKRGNSFGITVIMCH
jgi:hypothetical protein